MSFTALKKAWSTVQVLATLQLLILRFIAASVLYDLRLCHGGRRRALPEKPRTGEQYAFTFIAPRPGDARSPCPALNAMANHGYLPRDGRNLTRPLVIRALQSCYALSYPLASFIGWGALILLGHPASAPFTLHDLAQHGSVEHDASLVHENAPPGAKYTPIEVSQRLWNQLRVDARYGTYSFEDLARARVRRERVDGKGMSEVLRIVAQGEAGIILQVFGCGRFMAPSEMLLKWLKEERLPDGWEPEKQSTLAENIWALNKIKSEMEKVESKERED